MRKNHKNFKGFTLHFLRGNNKVGHGHPGESAGFTIAEMLVTTFIISFLSVILVVNWRQNEGKYQLQRTAQEIVQLIRQAQNFALNGRQMFWDPDGTWFVPDYYGVHFEKNSPTFYFVYGNRVGNYGYQHPEEMSETYTSTETGIEIDDLGGGGALDVIFVIPDGFISFYPGGKTSATITIKKTGKTCPSSDCKYIELSDKGEISIN